MSEEIKKKHSRYFRIHETGDFYSQCYLDKWFEIIRENPKTLFMAWTKSWHLDWSRKPKNLTMYWSISPDSIDIPKDGNFAYIKMKDIQYNIPEGFTCPYPKKKCNECMRCFTNPPKILIFNEH